MSFSDFKEFLFGKSQKRALNLDDLFWDVYDQMEVSYPGLWLINLFVDQAGDVFALASNGSNKLKLSVTLGTGDTVMLGEPMEVVQEFLPVQRNNMVAKTNTQILRTKGDLAGWLSVSATALVNRDGAIDSRDLFDSFVNFADKTGFYPIRTFYHMYDESIYSGQSHVLLRVGNCYVTAGTYFGDSDFAQAEIRAFSKNPDMWGESIGFLPTARPQTLATRDWVIPVYTEGINFEISTLPEPEASSWFTSPSIMEVRTMGQQDMDAMLVRQKKAMAQLFEIDEAAVEERLQRTAGVVNGIIEQNGLMTRSDANTQPADGQPQAQTQPQGQTPQSVAQEVVATTQDLLNGDNTVGQLAVAVENRMQQLADAFQSNMAEFRTANQATNVQIVEALEGITQRVTAIEQNLTTRQQFAQSQPRAYANGGGGGFSPVRQRAGLQAGTAIPTLAQTLDTSGVKIPDNIQPVTHVNATAPGQPVDATASLLQADLSANKLDAWNPVGK